MHHPQPFQGVRRRTRHRFCPAHSIRSGPQPSCVGLFASWGSCASHRLHHRASTEKRASDHAIPSVPHPYADRGRSVDTPEMHHADSLSARTASPHNPVIRTCACANMGCDPASCLDSRGSCLNVT
jgi:hypothetical protein